MAHGEIPLSAVSKAQRAYGESVEHYAVKIVNHLLQKDEVRQASRVLQMHSDDAFDAIAALRADVRRLWPDGCVEDDHTF